MLWECRLAQPQVTQAPWSLPSLWRSQCSLSYYLCHLSDPESSGRGITLNLQAVMLAGQCWWGRVVRGTFLSLFSRSPTQVNTGPFWCSWQRLPLPLGSSGRRRFKSVCLSSVVVGKTVVEKGVCCFQLPGTGTCQTMHAEEGLGSEWVIRRKHR